VYQNADEASSILHEDASSWLLNDPLDVSNWFEKSLSEDLTRPDRWRSKQSSATSGHAGGNYFDHQPNVHLSLLDAGEERHVDGLTGDGFGLCR
jgi:hypothetical protein